MRTPSNPGEIAVHVQDHEVVLEAHGEFVFMTPEAAFWLARELVEAMQRAGTA